MSRMIARLGAYSLSPVKINPPINFGFTCAAYVYHSVGVNSHHGYPTYGNDWAATIAKMQDLGVLHVRETLFPIQDTNGAASWDALNMFQGTGIKLLVGPLVSWTQQNPSYHYTVSDWFNCVGNGTVTAMFGQGVHNQVRPSLIDAISMPNEPPGGIEQDLHAWQLDLKKQTHSRYPEWPVVGIAPQTGDQAANLNSASQDTYGPSPTYNGPYGVTTCTDVVDGHPYRGGTSTFTDRLTGDRADFAVLTNAQIYGTGLASPASNRAVWKKMFATEAGYVSFPNGTPQSPYSTFAALTGYAPGFGQNPCSESVKAEYIVRTILHHYFCGISRTYLNEFMDQIWDTGANGYSTAEAWFGLCDGNLNARASYTAVKNLLTILGDTTAPAVLVRRNASVSGFTPQADYIADNGEHIPDELGYFTCQKLDDSYLVFVWRTTTDWDRVNFAPVTPNTQNLTVTLSGMVGASYCNPATSDNPDQSLTVSNPGTESASVTIPVGGAAVAIKATF